MEFIINKESLLEVLSKVEKLVKTKTSNPILQGFYLEVKSDKIIVIGSDLNTTIRYELPVLFEDESILINKEGKVVVPYQLYEIAKKVKTELSISLDDTQLVIKHGKKKKSEFKLSVFKAEEYPKLPRFDGIEPTLSIKGTEFNSFIKKTGYAASSSDARPVLQGICFEITEDKLRLVCTDSHRLGVIDITESHKESRKIIIPAKSILESLKSFDLSEKVTVFCENDRMLILQNNNLTFYCRLLEGTYPDVSRLIPKEHLAEMKISRKEFLEGFEMISGLTNAADNETKGIVKLHVNGVATLSTYQAQTGSGKIEIDYESLEGEDNFDIAFNNNYMIDTLKAMESEYVSFKYQGSMRPFLLTPCDSSHEEIQLILPVRNK